MEEMIRKWKQFRDIAYDAHLLEVMPQAQLRQLVRSFVAGYAMGSMATDEPLHLHHIMMIVLDYSWQPGEEWK